MKTTLLHIRDYGVVRLPQELLQSFERPVVILIIDDLVAEQCTLHIPPQNIFKSRTTKKSGWSAIKKNNNK